MPQSGLTLSQAFKQKIKELLEERGLSQEALARQLGVKQPTVSYLLNPTSRRQKRAHPLDFIEQVAKIFDLPLSVLVAELEARVRAVEGSRRAKVVKRLFFSSYFPESSRYFPEYTTPEKLDALQRYLQELTTQSRLIGEQLVQLRTALTSLEDTAPELLASKATKGKAPPKKPKKKSKKKEASPQTHMPDRLPSSSASDSPGGHSSRSLSEP